MLLVFVYKEMKSLPASVNRFYFALDTPRPFLFGNPFVFALLDFIDFICCAVFFMDF